MTCDCRFTPFLALIAIASSCAPAEESKSTQPDPEPGIEFLDPRMNALIPPGTEIEILAEGFTWSEGPVWVEDGGYLLFSDVPENRIHKWSEAEGFSQEYGEFLRDFR